MAPNFVKYRSYAEAWRRIKIAIERGYYFVACYRFQRHRAQCMDETWGDAKSTVATRTPLHQFSQRMQRWRSLATRILRQARQRQPMITRRRHRSHAYCRRTYD